MKIHYTAPAEKGVTSLMYVGDDGLPGIVPPTSAELALGAIGLLVALKSSGVVRLGAATLAGIVGLHYFKTRTTS